MGLTTGAATLLKTAQQSFWQNYVAIPDPFEGLVHVRQSDQLTDTLPFHDAAPMPQALVADREAKVVNEYSETLTNVHYDSTVKIDKKLIKFQQWDAIAGIVGNQGTKARAHQTQLLTTLMVAGEATTGYDGSFFYVSTHTNPGASYTTAQDNLLGSAAGTGTIPTDLELALGIRSCFDGFYGFKDGWGDPVVPNTDAGSDFILMIPPEYLSVARRVEQTNTLTGPLGNDLQGRFTTRVNPFITASDTFYMFYAGGPHKPFILNEAGGLSIEMEQDYLGGGHAYHSASWWGTTNYGEWRTAIAYTYT